MSVSSDLKLARGEGYWIGSFAAMASVCEVLMEVSEPNRAWRLLEIAAREAWRIERKFSRYRKGNIVYRINTSNGRPVEVDEETGRLLDFAQQLYELSEGFFDITSGVLRKVWKFDGSDRIPTRTQIETLLPRVGWHKLTWQNPHLTLQPGMEIDFGGIGKEYAVDRAAHLLAAKTTESCLINFGGDLMVSRPRAESKFWHVGIEATDSAQCAERNIIDLNRGGLATSGDTKRFLIKDNRRYGHVLNPRTGWPIDDAPRSITVAAGTCTEAGMLATLALLKGLQAESFLSDQGVSYWCVR